MKLPHIGMLWIGGDLSFLEILCIQSFLDAGHDVHVFTYGDVGNLPSGVDLLDARLILDLPMLDGESRLDATSVNSDVFRIRLLAEIPGMIWADTDVYCLRPLNPSDGHYYGYEVEGRIGSAVLALPATSAALGALLHAAGGAGDKGENLPDTFGSAQITRALTDSGEIGNALPEATFYPVRFEQRGHILRPGFLTRDSFDEGTTTIRLHGSRLKRMMSHKFGGLPPEGSLLAALLARHDIQAHLAPLPKDDVPGRALVKQAKRPEDEKFLVLACMKDEGAFVLEWIAFYKAIGFDHFLVYTNDCSDGTDKILMRLEDLGHATHRDNTRHEGDRPSYQIRAYRKAMREHVYQTSDWAMIVDADEFVNVHAGDKTIRDLVKALPREADLISLNWRLFGYGGVDRFQEGFLTQQFTRAAPYDCPRPAQAWGMKSMFRTSSFARLGLHRPHTPHNDDWSAITWVNGSGKPMPERYQEITGANWRSTRDCFGYDLAQINHYAVRSRESFLLKSLKGMAHGGIDRNRGYWERMNRNEEEDLSIQSLIPEMRKIYEDLLSDPVLAELHEAACKWHRERIGTALQIDEIRSMFGELV